MYILGVRTDIGEDDIVNLRQTIVRLQAERSRFREEVNRLDQVISILEKLARKGPLAAGLRRGKSHKLSAEGRQRIIEAQKARWAKARKQKRNAA